VSVRFELLERTDGVVYGICGGIFVMMLFAEPTLSDMNAAHPALKTMSKRKPEGFPTLTWVLPQAGFRMSAEARKRASDITRELDKSVIAQATLIEGAGFQAATVRAIVSGLDFVIRSTSVKKVFSELPPAVEWCRARGSAAGDVGAGPQITASLLDVRASVVDK